jgi:uncharacterized sulfatase
VAAALALVAALGGCRRAPVKRPNVLVIAAGGLSTRLGCYGDFARTPQADRLARLGRRFERAYRPYPDAARARAAWLGGRWDPGNGPALPALFAGARYAPLEVTGATAAEAAAGAAAAIARLKDGRAQDRPFFLTVALPAPEPGWLPPAEYVDAYSMRDVPPFAAVDPRASAPRIALADAGQPVPPAPSPLPEDQERRRRIAERAVASYLDAQVGLVLAALDGARLWDETVVVLVGEAAPPDAPALRADLLRESTLRVPLIVAAPGLRRAGRAAAAPVSLLDLAPTLADLAGITASFDGHSLRPLLDAPDAAAPPVVSEVARAADPIARSVRTEEWRYTRWPDGSRELYDHVRDDAEFVNLASRSDQQARMADLERLAQRAESSGGSNQQSAISNQTRRRTGRGEEQPLNVVLIVVDDLAARLGCYGYDVRTPSVDALAARGRRFERAYAQVPSCNPSRVSFMTGWLPTRSGIWSNVQPPRPQIAGAVPLQERFRAAGYFTARVGKVYHGPFEDQFRWDLSEHTPYPDGDDEEPPERGRGMASWWRPTGNADADEPDGRAARRAASLIARARKPFFIALGLNKPHLRWVAPRRYFDLYPPGSIRWPPEPQDDAADVPEIAIARRAPRHPGALLPGRLEPEDLRAPAIAAYQACTSFMDAQVGVVTRALDRARLWERTVVVFTSDHGFHLGEHGGLWRKNTLFEETLRVPLVIVAPGLEQPGRPAARVVELVDVYPTLLELAGLSAASPLDGVSLGPVLRDPAAGVKPAALSMTERVPPARGRSLRTARWRYTLWPDGSEELYDEEADPRESRNLAADASHAGTKQELRAQLTASVS